MAFLIVAVAVTGCATKRFEPGTTVEALDLRTRALTKTEDGIRVSAAVLSEQDGKVLFGVDLATRGIQPVWLEVENHTGRPVWLLPTGLDPGYFAPLEVAFAFRGGFSRESRASMNEYFDTMGFSNLVLPGATVSGFVHTNFSSGTKVVSVDLWGTKWSKSFTLFVPVPGYDVPLPDFDTLYGKEAVPDYHSEEELRLALEKLPCCIFDEFSRDAAPANLVLIGSVEDIGAALIRRGYRYMPLEPRRLFGRVQDLSGVKTARWAKPQGQQLRLWLAPLRYRGRAVWLGAINQRLGGRFAADAKPAAGVPMDPEVDEALTSLLMDMMYSQGLVKLGFVEGAGGGPTAADTAQPSSGYNTRGLRAVMVFERRPVSLAELQHFDWARLVDRE